MQVANKSMNWMPKKSAYKVMAEATAKRRAMVEEFQSKNSNLASSLSTAFSNQLAGTVENAQQTAIERIQAQMKAKQDEVTEKFNSVNMQV